MASSDQIDRSRSGRQHSVRAGARHRSPPRRLPGRLSRRLSPRPTDRERDGSPTASPRRRTCSASCSTSEQAAHAESPSIGRRGVVACRECGTVMGHEPRTGFAPILPLRLRLGRCPGSDAQIPAFESAAAAPGIPGGGYPFRLGVASGSPQPDGVVLWTRLVPDLFVAGGGMPPQGAGRLEGRDRPRHASRRAPRECLGAPSARALGARAAARAPPGPRLLLPVPLPAGRDRGRPHPHGAEPARTDRIAGVRGRLLPEVGRRLLLGVPGHGRGGHRLRPPPRRLRLRVRHRPQRRPSGDAGPGGPRALAGRPSAMADAIRAAQERPAAPAHPPPVPVRRHVGRPRGLQRLRQHPRLQR